nr:hypothetical protein L195_g010371 [Ipomoea trifida]
MKVFLFHGCLAQYIKEEAQPSIAEDATTYDVWSSLEEQLLPITIEKEGLLKNMLMTIKKGSRSLDDYTKEFKSICDNLAAIKKPVDDLDKVFQFARGLGAKYENFRLAMVTKPPYPTFNQFLLALQGYEQTIASQKEEEKNYIEYNQALFSQRGRGRGRRGSFNSKGRGFTPAGRYNNAGSNNFKRDGTNGIVQQSKGDKPTCQICGKLNHIALDCWYRFDYSYQSEDLPQALAALTLNNNDPSFYMDSGATAHMTNNAGMLSYTKPYKGNDVIYVGNGNKLDITHSGNACIGELNLKDVLVVPKLKKNLISVSKITSENFCTVEFTSSDFVIKDHNKRTIGKGHRQGQLYALEPGFQEALSAIKGDNSFSVWHQRLGHPSAKILSLLKGKKSPYSKLYHKEPNYKSLRVFGCLCFPSLRHQGGNKFVKKTYPCVFIGYSPIHKGYRCYEPRTKRVYISRHVVFDEGKFLYKPSSPESIHVPIEFAEFPSLDEWFKVTLEAESPKVGTNAESATPTSIITTIGCCDENKDHNRCYNDSNVESP